MPGQPLISVRGEAVVEVEPEIAVVSVAVSARDKDRQHAVNLLARRGAEVTALARSHGDAVERIEGGTAHVRPEFKDNKPRERIAGYVAAAQFALTVCDFAVLADLVSALANQDMVAVSGPWWQLRPDSLVHRQARLRAAEDAMDRAREYAAAFRGTLTGLVEVADTGLISDSGPTDYPMAAPMAARLMRSQADEPSFDFQPVRQTVRASVEARFTMTAPDLSAPEGGPDG